MQEKRIVITGMGAISPLGNSVEESWNAVKEGKSGIGKVTRFDSSNLNCHIAGEVKDFDYTAYYPEEHSKLAKRMDAFIHYAVAATKEAVEQAGLVSNDFADRTGIFYGSGLGGINVQTENTKNLLEKGPRRVSPFYIPTLIGNMAAGFLSMIHGIKGPNLALQTACATGNHAIGTGIMAIRSGMADIMVVGGTEGVINEIVMAGFANMRALSTRNDDPATASRPYDKDRDGFVMSEGAATLIIEEYEHAVKRGAPILAEVLSMGMSGDAYDMVVPHPEGDGAYAAMKMAVDMAGINANDLDYVNSHGTSTPLGDKAEGKAINRLLNGDTEGTAVGSTKSMHGHLLGATAALEAVLCVKALQEGLIPGNRNIENLDTEVPLENIPTENVKKDIKYVLSNSFGFGGHNSSLLLGKM